MDIQPGCPGSRILFDQEVSHLTFLQSGITGTISLSYFIFSKRTFLTNSIPCSPGVDPKKLEAETGNFKCGDYDGYGVCKDNKYIYFDGTDSYGMARARDVGADFFPGVLQVAFDKNWTTPKELYVDAQACAFKAEEEQTNATELDTGCAVSQLLALLSQVLSCTSMNYFLTHFGLLVKHPCVCRRHGRQSRHGSQSTQPWLHVYQLPPDARLGC